MIFFIPKICINQIDFFNKNFDKNLQNTQETDISFSALKIQELEDVLNTAKDEIVGVFNSFFSPQSPQSQLQIYIDINKSETFKVDYINNSITIPEGYSFEKIKSLTILHLIKLCLVKSLLGEEIFRLDNSNNLSNKSLIIVDIITDSIVHNSTLCKYDFLKIHDFYNNLIIEKENVLLKWREEFKHLKIEDFVISVYKYVKQNESVFNLIKINY